MIAARSLAGPLACARPPDPARRCQLARLIPRLIPWLIVIGAGGACSGADDTDVATEPIAAGATSPRTQGTEEHVAAVDARLTEAECRACHPEAADQWASSRHHASYSNEDFQRSYAREPLDFCRECHAPALVRAAPLPDDEAEALGVGCLDCHASAGAVWTGPGSEPSDEAPHAVVRTADFGTASCARCHEFDFPATSGRPHGALMQKTMQEHRASPHADTPCAQCHLPRGDHSVASTRDPQALRGAVAIAAHRDGDALVLALTPRGVGHAFPTGDLYRRLALHAEIRSGDAPAVSVTRYLARHFPPRRRLDGTKDPRAAWPEPDDRLTGPAEVRLVMPAGHSGEVHWSVDYERVDSRDHHDPARSLVADRVSLASGALPW